MGFARRQREKAKCVDCGKMITIRSDGTMMAHDKSKGVRCIRPAWMGRHNEIKEGPK